MDTLKTAMRAIKGVALGCPKPGLSLEAANLLQTTNVISAHKGTMAARRTLATNASRPHPTKLSPSKPCNIRNT